MVVVPGAGIGVRAGAGPGFRLGSRLPARGFRLRAISQSDLPEEVDHRGCAERRGRAADIEPPDSSRGMAKRGRGAGADDDAAACEDVLKAAFKLMCKVYVSVGVEDVPAGDQLRHHALWVRSRPAARVALIPTRTRRDSTRCAFRSCAPAGGGPQDPTCTLRHLGCEHAPRRVDEGVPGDCAVQLDIWFIGYEQAQECALEHRERMAGAYGVTYLKGWFRLSVFSAYDTWL